MTAVQADRQENGSGLEVLLVRCVGVDSKLWLYPYTVKQRPACSRRQMDIRDGPLLIISWRDVFASLHWAAYSWSSPRLDIWAAARSQQYLINYVLSDHHHPTYTPCVYLLRCGSVILLLFSEKSVFRRFSTVDRSFTTLGKSLAALIFAGNCGHWSFTAGSLARYTRRFTHNVFEKLDFGRINRQTGTQKTLVWLCFCLYVYWGEPIELLIS